MLKTKIAILMSGGVDSSVSALLLKQKKIDLTGIYLNCSNFCNPKDEEDARKVAYKINIPFYSFDLTEEFNEKVINYFVETYKKGMTPNPDVYCNQFIKFGVFFEKALNLDFDFIASGHYAKTLKIVETKDKNFKLIENLKEIFLFKNNETILTKSKDNNKDQTYFLWKVDKEKLKRLIFPVGNLLKSQVKKIAEKNNLDVAYKKESMGICFVGKVKLKDFLNKFIEPKEGKIIDTKGKILGTHPGYFYFTEGQRHGLNIKKGDGPYYVAYKIPEENLIIVAKKDDPALFTRKIQIDEINILSLNIFKKIKEDISNGKNFFQKIHLNPEKPFTADVRFRHRQPLVKARIDLKNKTIEFKNPQKMISPGQAIVFYKNKIVLGGAIIYKRIS